MQIEGNRRNKLLGSHIPWTKSDPCQYRHYQKQLRSRNFSATKGFQQEVRHFAAINEEMQKCAADNAAFSKEQGYRAPPETSWVIEALREIQFREEQHQQLHAAIAHLELRSAAHIKHMEQTSQFGSELSHICEPIQVEVVLRCKLWQRFSGVSIPA